MVEHINTCTYKYIYICAQFNTCLSYTRKSILQKKNFSLLSTSPLFLFIRLTIPTWDVMNTNTPFKPTPKVKEFPPFFFFRYTCFFAYLSSSFFLSFIYSLVFSRNLEGNQEEGLYGHMKRPQLWEIIISPPCYNKSDLMSERVCTMQFCRKIG